MTRGVLHISYDGMLEALCQSLVLPLISLQLAQRDTAVLKARAQDFSIDKAVDRSEELLFPRQQEEHCQERRSK